MTDLALEWRSDVFAGDLRLEGGRLATDDGLRTAILISLFTDARASDEALLPEAGLDRRGWWGDAWSEPGAAGAPFNGTGSQAGTARDANRIGSLLWLLARSKITPAVIEQAREAASEALGWLVRDGVARRVTVEVEAQGQTMAIGVVVERPDGPGRERFDFAWEASA